jgi:hypothetical protein
MNPGFKSTPAPGRMGVANTHQVGTLPFTKAFAVSPLNSASVPEARTQR